MIEFILGVFKYTFFVITVLVLSHIVQIKGITISRHVENSLNWISGENPARKITSSVQDLTSGLQRRNEELNKAAEFSDEDQKQLNQVIQKSQQKKK